MGNLNNDKNENVSINKAVVITGVTQGLGYSLAKKFSIDKYVFVGTYRNKTFLENLKTIKVLPIKCDVRNENDIKNAISQIENTFGKIDILINNAGIRIESPVEKMSLKEWGNVIHTNLTGTFLMTKYALPLLKRSKNAVIINISSVRGLYGGKDLSAYSASKFGTIGFTQSLAEELKENGIKVYSICPAAMDADMIKNVKHNIPQEKLIQPDEMANVIFTIAANPKEPTGTTFVIIGKQTEILRKLEKAKNYKIIQWE